MPSILNSAIALITLAQAKDFLLINTTNQDNTIEDMINGASRLINSYCGRQFIQTSYTKFYDGDGTNELILEDYPIVSVTSVHDDVLRAFGASTLVASTDYLIRKETGVLELLNGLAFYKGQANVKVVYAAGYPIASMPEDLQLACKKLIAFVFYERKDGRYGQVAQSQGTVNVNFSLDTIPEDVVEILKAWKAHGQANRSMT